MVGFPLLHGSRVRRCHFNTIRNVLSILTVAGLGVPLLGQTAVHGLPPVPQVAGVPAAAQQAAQKIDPERIRASVKYLADDKLEGRGPGTEGDRMAAKYLADQFASYGVTPAGDNGSWYQKVPLYAVRTVPDKTTFQLVPKEGEPLTLKYGADFVTNNQTGAAVADIDAPIVFVGYGIHAPEYNWDDYKGVDVRGKVVLVIVNEPPSEDAGFFKGKALTYYGRWTYKFEEAGRQGAIGALIIHREDLASYPWQVVRSSWSGEKSYLVGDPDATLEAAAWIQHDIAGKLAESAGYDIDDVIEESAGKHYVSRETTWRLKAHIVSEKRSFDSENVVGMVAAKGAGPEQSVLYTAHFDHLGMDKNAAGRQDLQRRGGQRDGLRHSAGVGARVRRCCEGRNAAAASRVLRGGDRGRARSAGFAVPGDASAGAAEGPDARSELRHAAADWRADVDGGIRCGADDVLSDRGEHGEGFRSDDSARPVSGRGTLLPLRSFLAGALWDSGVFDWTGHALCRTRCELG